jgi:hypothetical protein
VAILASASSVVYGSGFLTRERSPVVDHSTTFHQAADSPISNSMPPTQPAIRL